MTNDDQRFRKTLSRLDVPAMPAGLMARLTHISDRQQARGFAGFMARLGSFEDLSFALRYDLRYQAVAAGLILTLSLGAWQGLQLSHIYSGNAGFSDEAAVMIEADPVLSGTL